jgi:hypothetical protein
MVVHEAFHWLHERYVSGRLQQSQDAPALTLALVSGTRKGSPTSASLEGEHEALRNAKPEHHLLKTQRRQSHSLQGLRVRGSGFSSAHGWASVETGAERKREGTGLFSYRTGCVLYGVVRYLIDQDRFVDGLLGSTTIVHGFSPSCSALAS